LQQCRTCGLPHMNCIAASVALLNFSWCCCCSAAAACAPSSPWMWPHSRYFLIWCCANHKQQQQASEGMQLAKQYACAIAGAVGQWQYCSTKYANTSTGFTPDRVAVHSRYFMICMCGPTHYADEKTMQHTSRKHAGVWPIPTRSAGSSAVA
jgi:hypothetical protein